MSKLNTLCGKSKVYTIGGVELSISPATLQDLELMMRISKEETRGEAMSELIKKTLKRAVPDATEEELNSIGLEHAAELSNAIAEVNNFTQDGKE
jgi:predicted glycosyltransferase